MRKELDIRAALAGLALAWPGGRAGSAGTAIDVEIVTDPELLPIRLASVAGTATLFQTPAWLSCWYATVGASQHAEPLLVIATERCSGLLSVALPLIRVRTGATRRIQFADLGVTDYNAPILGPAAPATPAAARSLWRRILAALPDADLIDFRKMPARLEERPNPLALLGETTPSSIPGFTLTLPDDWNVYLRSLTKKFRKELGRSERLFEAAGGTQFCEIIDPDEARAVLAAMDRQQDQRLKQMGYVYALAPDAYHSFYAQLVADGIARGTTLLTALKSGEDIVASLLGVTDGRSVAMLRLSHTGNGEWARVGLGRLILSHTMRTLHARGCRRLDFSIGDYPYKAGFGTVAQPVCDLASALSWRGAMSAAPELMKAQAKRALRSLGVSLVPKDVRERYRRHRLGGGAQGEAD